MWGFGENIWGISLGSFSDRIYRIGRIFLEQDHYFESVDNSIRHCIKKNHCQINLIASVNPVKNWLARKVRPQMFFKTPKHYPKASCKSCNPVKEKRPISHDPNNTFKQGSKRTILNTIFNPLSLLPYPANPVILSNVIAFSFFI